MNPVQPADRSYAAASVAPSRSARIAEVEGNIMSGVTVATIRRSMSLPARPDCSRALSIAGNARSESASESAAIRRSRIPVRSTSHSSEVASSRESSSFVTTRSGTCAPRPEIVTWTSLRPVPIKSCLALAPDEDRERRLHGGLVRDARASLALRDRPAHTHELALEVEDVARLDDSLEAAVVDPREERDLAPVRLVGKDRDRAALRDRLDREDAGHHRTVGEVAREPQAVLGDEEPPAHAATRIQLDDLVHEQEGGAVRNDRLDRLPAERSGREAHATSRSSSRSRRRLRPRCA